MRRLVGASLLLALVVAVPTVDLYAQKDKKKKDAPPDKGAVDSSKLSGEFIGELKTVPGSDRVFILTKEIEKLVATGKGGNPNALRGNNNANRVLQLQRQIAQDQAQMQRARDARQRQQAMRRLQQHYLQLQQATAQLTNNAGKGGGLPPGYKIEKIKQDIEFQASDTPKVRTMFLSEVFDDKGNVKKYSKTELAELKGKDKNLPGYESSMEKLEAGQKIRVKLSPTPVKKKDDVDADDKDDKKMQVSLIVILEESKGVPQKGKKNKK